MMFTRKAAGPLISAAHFVCMSVLLFLQKDVGVFFAKPTGFAKIVTARDCQLPTWILLRVMS